MISREELEAKLKPRAALNYLFIECKPGWFGLIEELAEKIAEIDPDYKIVQIKEKYGTLRFYTESSSDSVDIWDKIEEIAQEYEDKSLTVCEECGGAGKEGRVSGYYWCVRCEKCAPEGFVSNEDAEKKYDL